MGLAGFKRGFRRAYRHEGGIKVLALGRLDAGWFAELQKEMAWVISSQSSSNVGSPAHTTNWTRPIGEARQFSLFNPTGRPDEYLSDFAPPAKVRKRLVFPELKATARFAALFGADLWNLRLNGLGKQSGLSAHEEDPITPGRWRNSYKVRLHLPVYTNAGACVYLDDERFHFAEGHLYFFHHGCVHSAVNPMEEPRYHLVLDCNLSSALFRRVFPGGGSSTPDKGYTKLSPVEAAPLERGEPAPLGAFVTEDGRTISTGIRYGRHLPSPLDYYRKNYPSLLPAPRLVPRPL